MICIIGIVFISSFFYYVIGLLFYNFLVEFVSLKFKIYNWPKKIYYDCPMAAATVWPIVFTIWICEMFFTLPFTAANKLLEKICQI